MTFSGTVNVLSVRQVKPMVTIVGLVISHCLAGAGCHRAQPYLGNAWSLPPSRTHPHPPIRPRFSVTGSERLLRAVSTACLGGVALGCRFGTFSPPPSARREQPATSDPIGSTQQSAQLASEERSLLRRQLQDVTNQLQQTQIASASARGQMQEQLQGMTEQMRSAEASHRLRGGARLTANSSLPPTDVGLAIAWLPVIQDGDVIRLRVPADQLFQPNTRL